MYRKGDKIKKCKVTPPQAEKRLHAIIKDCPSSDEVDKFAWEIIPFFLKTGLWQQFLLFGGIDANPFVSNLVKLMIVDGKIALESNEVFKGKLGYVKSFIFR